MDKKPCSHGRFLSPLPQVPDNKESWRGHLYSPNLGAEEGILSWTSEPATGLIWITPPNYFIYIFGNAVVNTFVNFFGNAVINVFNKSPARGVTVYNAANNA